MQGIGREAGKASRAPQLAGLSMRLLIALGTTGGGHGGHKPYHYRKVTLFTKCLKPSVLLHSQIGNSEITVLIL